MSCACLPCHTCAGTGSIVIDIGGRVRRHLVDSKDARTSGWCVRAPVNATGAEPMTSTTINPDDELLTIEYVCDHLYVTRRQVERWMRDGTLTRVRLGRKTHRITRRSFQAFVLSKTDTAPDH